MIDTCGAGAGMNQQALGVFLWGIAGAILLLLPISWVPPATACLTLGPILGILHSIKMVRAIGQRNRSVEAGTITMLQLLEPARRLR